MHHEKHIQSAFHHKIKHLSKFLASLFTLLTVCKADIAQYSPSPHFNGTQGITLKQSQAAYSEYSKHAPKGAPNIIYILMDDVGYGSSSAFGGLIQTPTFDSLANNGLRFTNFHTTAMCSPTRAALLTGRNAHSVHMGWLIDGAYNFPGYDAHMPFEKATAAEILKENGYNTFAVGKWHLTPYEDMTQAGPFNRWPTGRGFDHYFGFLAGETDQWYAQLVENTTKVEPDTKGKLLTTVLVDKAISYIADQKSAAPNKPFFLYFPPAAAHAPHQASKQWLDKYRGKFNMGWDKYREQVLANQKKLGIVPKDAVLPPLNPGIKPWDSLSPQEQKVFARFMEAYAAFLSEADFEIGRLVTYLKEIDQLHNTLIFLIVGDNGASKEGGFAGVSSGIPQRLVGDDYQKNLALNASLYNEIGFEKSSTNFPLGWAMAANTPYRYWKTDANSEGGTRNGLIVFYPDGIKDKGGIRTQYTHVNNILPTTLEVVGATIPQEINGYPQDSLEGKSFAYAFDHPDAPSAVTQQYYELGGSRAMYKDGWKAAAYHIRGADFEQEQWELYNLNEDFNERNNLSEKNPEKLRALQQLFDEEARKYNVYPLHDNGSLLDTGRRKNMFAGRKHIELLGPISQLHPSAFVSLVNTPFSITANITVNDANADGALFAYGGRFNGFSLYIKENKLQVAHNVLGKLSYLETQQALPRGTVTIRYECNYGAAGKDSTAGTEALYINNKKVAERALLKNEGFIFEYDEGVDVGADNQSAITPRYQAPYRFSGKLNKLTIDLK